MLFASAAGDFASDPPELRVLLEAVGDCRSPRLAALAFTGVTLQRGVDLCLCAVDLALVEAGLDAGVGIRIRPASPRALAFETP